MSHVSYTLNQNHHLQGVVTKSNAFLTVQVIWAFCHIALSCQIWQLWYQMPFSSYQFCNQEFYWIDWVPGDLHWLLQGKRCHKWGQIGARWEYICHCNENLQGSWTSKSHSQFNLCHLQARFFIKIAVMNAILENLAYNFLVHWTLIIIKLVVWVDILILLGHIPIFMSWWCWCKRHWNRSKLNRMQSI